MTEEKKTRRYDKTYLVIDLTDDEGEIQIRRMTPCDIEALASRTDHGNFAVIDGQLLKPFCRKLDPRKLR